MQNMTPYSFRCHVRTVLLHGVSLICFPELPEWCRSEDSLEHFAFAFIYYCLKFAIFNVPAKFSLRGKILKNCETLSYHFKHIRMNRRHHSFFAHTFGFQPGLNVIQA